jgi:cytoskeleton protein RodZ
MTEEHESADIPECGRQLRRMREQLGLSIDDVAMELRLSGFQIQALEDDNWDQLPGTTYARGYLRSYARLLGLDGDQLLAGASTQEIEISRTEPAIAARSPESRKTGGERPGGRVIPGLPMGPGDRPRSGGGVGRWLFGVPWRLGAHAGCRHDGQ